MKSKALLKWYNMKNYPMPWRKNKDSYRVWISEVMLQQTQVQTVIPYYNNWMKSFPHVKDVANESVNVLLKYWEGLGYYKRLHNIKNAADIIMSEHNGKMPTGNGLRALPGIGDYIYSAISSIEAVKRNLLLNLTPGRKGCSWLRLILSVKSASRCHKSTSEPFSWRTCPRDVPQEPAPSMAIFMI